MHKIDCSSDKNLSRRELLASAAAIAVGGGFILPSDLLGQSVSSTQTNGETAIPKKQFRFSLNTSTIRGQNLTVPEQVDVASKAGYDVIEPWIGDLRKYVEKGGKLEDLRKQISDQGLTVESSIGFANWIVEDAAAREKALEEAKRDMEMIALIGGKRIAAPAAGATKDPKFDHRKVAERFRALLELGDKTGITPELEIWGFSTNLTQLGECLLIASEADHPKALVLADVYHLYKGGSPFPGLRFLPAEIAPVVHMNDYPQIAPDKIVDADRIYPGDGTAPLTEVLTLLAMGGPRVLSLELFNHDYWKQPALDVAKTGLEKMKRAVEAAKLS